MVAYDSRRTPNGPGVLSPETTAELRAAIEGMWSDQSAGNARLVAAMQRAASESREAGLYPETLLIAMKRIEEDVAASRADIAPLARRGFREWLVTACLEAYFPRSSEAEAGTEDGVGESEPGDASS